jgi:hypothetical protein
MSFWTQHDQIVMLEKRILELESELAALRDPA